VLKMWQKFGMRRSALQQKFSDLRFSLYSSETNGYQVARRKVNLSHMTKVTRLLVVGLRSALIAM